MSRETYVTNFVIQFDNPVVPPQWGAPVLLSHVSIVKGPDGTSLYQPAFTTIPAAASDISDELLANLKARLAILGLNISRIEDAV